MEFSYHVYIVLSAALIIYSLFSKLLNKLCVTGPVYMLFFGGLYAVTHNDSKVTLETFQIVIELTLAMILFSDAAKTKLSVLRHSYRYPLRLLLFGLPITFLFGTIIAIYLFPSFLLVQAALLAIILTPTDAALSSDFLENKQMPEPIREAVNVESGLNDGLAVPFFVLLMYVYVEHQTLLITTIPLIVLEEIFISLAVAVLLTPLLCRFVIYSEKNNLFSHEVEGFILIPITLIVYFCAQSLGGSGFFATFMAGLLFDAKYKSNFKPQRLSDAHALSTIIALIIWFVFAIFSYPYLTNGVSLAAFIYAVCSLTIIRLLSVIIATSFSGLTWRNRLILGWFGPRGLASVVFTLILINEASVPENLIDATIITVLLSALLHGVSAKLIVPKDH